MIACRLNSGGSELSMLFGFDTHASVWLLQEGLTLGLSEIRLGLLQAFAAYGLRL